MTQENPYNYAEGDDWTAGEYLKQNPAAAYYS